MKIKFKFSDDTETLSPIKVATALMEHTTKLEPAEKFMGIISINEIQTFDISDLREIAEHLIVYCNNTGGSND